MRADDKFLVKLFGSLSNKQIFFAIWACVVLGFVMMMWNYFRKSTRSNFRTPSDGPAPRINVDSRRLPGREKGGDVVVRDNPPTKKR